jgi:hypothetical protein
MASKYSVIATREIKSTAGKVHDLLVNLGRTEEWNPYVEMDPALKSEFSDQKIGVGAWYAYQSSKVGNGRMELTSATPSVVSFKLEFIGKKKTDIASSRYMISPGSTPETVTVTWEMIGTHSIMSKMTWVFFSKMMYKAFDRGLEKLATLVE